MAGVLPVDVGKARLAGLAHRPVGGLCASIEMRQAREPSAHQIRGGALLVVAGAVLHAHGNRSVDMSTVRVAGLVGMAVVLEADLVKGRLAGAVVVEEAVTPVVARVAAIDATI